jgi:hypothetical protein
MDGLRAFEDAVRGMGFIGAHAYPHWFETPPDHARWYPFYAKCVELDIPVQLQVGQSLVYDRRAPKRSVGRPITLDAVACDGDAGRGTAVALRGAGTDRGAAGEGSCEVRTGMNFAAPSSERDMSNCVTPAGCEGAVEASAPDAALGCWLF